MLAENEPLKSNARSIVIDIENDNRLHQSSLLRSDPTARLKGN